MKKTGLQVVMQEYRVFFPAFLKISPLRPAKGAVIVDTSKVNKKQMLDMLSKIVEKKLKKKYGRNL